MDDGKQLTQLAIDFVMSYGACAAGVATTETLAGGPPSTSLEYVLPGAKSAVSFAVPLDQEKIERFLSKQDHAGHQQDNIRTNVYVTGLAVSLATYLDQCGYPSYGVSANAVYRKDTPRGIFDFTPDVSHRYLAVRSGVGWFGLSGNVITKTHGAAVILGSMVTTADLDPTDPLPADEKYCDDCRLCMASCASGLMHKKERTTVTMGGMEFGYSQRRTYRRCDLVCGGFTGLAKNGKWSTWSPGRFPMPEKDEEFEPVLLKAITDSWPRPEIKGGFYHPAMPAQRKLNLTCGNCQLICHPDRAERKRRYKLLTKSGVVVQRPDGALEAVPLDVAKQHLAEMSPAQRACYEDMSAHSTLETREHKRSTLEAGAN
jgi:epoxyqueuosine reductase QueG